MEQESKKDYLTVYSIIPKKILKEKSISSLDKLLLINITALCYKNGKCFATNKYFAELYGVNKNTISTSINKLVKNKILISKLDYTQLNLSKRYLLLCDDVWSKKSIGINKHIDTSINDNHDHNIKINNNKIISYDTDGVMLWNGKRCESTPCNEQEQKELESILAEFRGDTNE